MISTSTGFKGAAPAARFSREFLFMEGNIAESLVCSIKNEQ
jgi:hypothetical protein